MQFVLEESEIMIEDNLFPLHQLELVNLLLGGLDTKLVIQGALIGSGERPIEGFELLLQ